MKIDPDKILRIINVKNNFITNLILKFNFFHKYLYGLNYFIALREIKNNSDHTKKLINYVNTAISNTEYYSKYDNIKSLDDFLSNINFTSKNVILNNFNSVLNRSFDKKNFVYGTTSGTSGKPMKLYIPKNRYQYELASVHSVWKRYGWNYETRAVIRNHKLDDDFIYQIKPLTKEIIFDAFRLNDNYVREIHSILIKKKINFLQAYPSSAYLFCKTCFRLGLKLDSIKCIFTASEPLFDFQRNFIENTMGLKISNFYGHSEKLIFAGDCPDTDYLQFENFYGFVELIDSNGNQINKSGEIGELVGTGYYNNGMFMLRYKTGDYAEYVSNKCAKTGKLGLVVKNIQGHRNNNLIFKSDGTFTSTTALNLHDDLYDKIDGIQYIQSQKGCLKINLIKNNSFVDLDKDRFYNHFKYAMGANSKVEIAFVTKLTSLDNGKFPILISSISL